MTQICPPRNLAYRFVALLLLLLFLAACNIGSDGGSAQDSSFRVVATTTIVGDVISQVAGEQVDVQVLLPVGVDPHAFEPRPQDVAAIADADLVFASGAGLEEFLEPLLQNASTQAKIVEVSAGIALLPFEKPSHVNEPSHVDEPSQPADISEPGEDENEQHVFDPHTWMDPNNVIVWVRNMSAVLSTADPQNAGLYEANAAAYIQSLQELDAWIAQQSNRLPPERRKLVSDHRTLGYFASAYGYEIVGELVASISTNAQTSAQELAVLEDQIRAFEVPAIFVDQTVNPTLAEQLAQDTGIRLVRIYSGSLSPANGPAGTYLDMMRYNVSAIVDALNP